MALPARRAAMGWLRWFVRPSSQAKHWTEWSAPAIIFLRLPPDPTSATRLRALDPKWHRRFAAKRPARRLRSNLGRPQPRDRPRNRNNRSTSTRFTRW